jgi:hypothetical protein
MLWKNKTVTFQLHLLIKSEICCNCNVYQRISIGKRIDMENIYGEGWVAK